ncbi:MAG TPA: hypothetical protein VMV53_04980 [Acidimicrobiales bacterium]|nr:hypothetical protein [Acidimicrobiales bacterium]
MHPSFAPHGPTSPVTLLFDDAGLTQLAGVYPVAWQTPWGELENLQLVRTSRAMALFATVGDTRYCWRTHSLADAEELRTLVLDRGGVVMRRRRRAGAVAVVAVLLLASFAGGIGAWLSARGGPNELAAARAVNLTSKDLPPNWTTTSASVMGYLFPPSSQVITSTPTTVASSNATWLAVSSQFQGCVGVGAAHDRVYGAAGQMPDYQVSSPVFSSSSFQGIQVASTVQYYATTTMVRRDTAEMSRPNFGACFVASNATLLLREMGTKAVASSSATNWQPTTYAHGWARGGVIKVTLPQVGTPLYLVMVEATNGHYESTLGALVSSWPSSQLFLSGLVSTLKARMASSSSIAV